MAHKKMEKNRQQPRAEVLLPEVAMQLATRYRQEPIEGSQVFQLTEDWQEQVLVDTGYAQRAETLSRLEDFLQMELPSNIIIPNDAPITTQTLTSVLQRNTLTKNIFLGKRELSEEKNSQSKSIE